MTGQSLHCEDVTKSIGKIMPLKKFCTKMPSEYNPAVIKEATS
jgi:hypothetical protein